MSTKPSVHVKTGPSIKPSFNQPTETSTKPSVHEQAKTSAKPSVHEQTAPCTTSSPTFPVFSERSLLPFPGASRDFYRSQGRQWAKNNSRHLERAKTNLVEKDNENIGRCRGLKTGSLEENITELEDRIKSERSVKRAAELKSVLAVARELKFSMVITTRKAFDVYWENKNSYLDIQRGYYRASDTYLMLSQHLNIAQVIVSGKGYLCDAHNTDIAKIQETLTIMVNEKRDIAFLSEARRRLESSFETAIKCLDTKKDKDILVGIFANLTSVKTVMHLRNIQDRRATMRQALRTDAFYRNYAELAKSVLTVRNDMRNKQQQLFETKKLRKLTSKYFKAICDGRGRRLKCDEFPELPALLEYAFGQNDVLNMAGGGLEAHPKLYENTLYKAMDNKTNMREAREVILALSKEEIDVSLSCLYTYTMNCKKGTYQAKRHHIGKNVNANISLHKAPSTGHFKHPINAHWTTSHVNFICDEAHQFSSSCLIDSKDAKCIINGELPPVLKPGKTWKKFEYPDHTYYIILHIIMQ